MGLLRRLLFTFCVGVFALVLSACSEGGDNSADGDRKVREGAFFVDKEVTQKGGFFYRLEASYTVVETGELIDFDIVVGCNIRTTSYSYTGPSFVAERAPEVMVKPTSTGGAVMIKTPRVCQQIRLDRRVPDDFTPFAIWFDDVNDLSFGWGYATQGAYERENAKLAFHPGRITRATRADRKAWRKKAAAAYEQIGAIPGPWGYSEPQDDAGRKEQKRVFALNGGKRLGNFCNSMVYGPMPAVGVEIIETAAVQTPESIISDEFIVIKGLGPIQAKLKEYENRSGEEPRDFGGYSAPPLGLSIEGTLLKRPARGWIAREGIFVRHGYREHYPLLTYVEPPYLGFLKTGYVRHILFGPRWTGLAACGFSSPREANEIGPLEYRLSARDIALTTRVYPVYLNNELLFENAFDVCGNTICVPRMYGRAGFDWAKYPNPGG